jgi:hypothetical protein
LAPVVQRITCIFVCMGTRHVPNVICETIAFPVQPWAIRIGLVGEQPAARLFFAHDRNLLLEQRLSLCFSNTFRSTKMTTVAPLFAPARSCSTTWVNAAQQVSVGGCYPDATLANTACPLNWRAVESRSSTTTCCPKK